MPRLPLRYRRHRDRLRSRSLAPSCAEADERQQTFHKGRSVLRLGGPGRFTIEDVLQALHDKLVGRHPHVFGDTSLETAEEVLREWQALKHTERGQMGNDPIGDVPRELPALSRAQVVQQRAARAGDARSEEETRGALEQALAQLAEGPSSGRRTEQALGELLLAAVDLARARGVDAEQALRERVDDILAARRQTKSERAAPEHRA